MRKKNKEYPSPRFTSLEEEERYWETHSPLDEGYEGEVQTSKQRRSSFLSIRLAGDELTLLRDVAAKFGVGPSTCARLLMMSAVNELAISAKQEKMDMGIASPYGHDPTASGYSYESTPKRESTIVPPNIAIIPPREIEFNRILNQQAAFVLLQLCELCGFRVVPAESTESEELGRVEKTRP